MTVAPELLRSAGGRLEQVAAALSAGAARVDLARDAGWSGAAAVRARARSAELRDASGALADALRRVADEVSEAAGRARDAVERLDVARRRSADPTRPELHAAAEQEALEASADLVRRGQELVAALQRDPLALLPAWVASAVSAVQTGLALNDARGAGQRTWGYRTWVDRMRRPETGPRVRRLAERRFLAGSWWQQSRFVPRPAWLEAVAPGVGRTFLPFAVASGAMDAVDGGGYDGARGATTRVLGTAAAVAGVALVVGVGAPAVAVVAGGVLVAHALWSAGNAAWDDPRINGWLRRAGGAVASGARAVGSAVQAAATSVRDGVRDAVDGALRNIAGLGSGLFGWT